jgi:hypothetical protein
MTTAVDSITSTASPKQSPFAVHQTIRYFYREFITLSRLKSHLKMVSQDLLHSFFRRCTFSLFVQHGLYMDVYRTCAVGARRPSPRWQPYVCSVLPLELHNICHLDFTFNAINSLVKISWLPSRNALDCRVRFKMTDGTSRRCFLWRELELRLKKAQQISKHVEIPA